MKNRWITFSGVDSLSSKQISKFCNFLFEFANNFGIGVFIDHCFANDLFSAICVSVRLKSVFRWLFNIFYSKKLTSMCSKFHRNWCRQGKWLQSSQFSNFRLGFLLRAMLIPSPDMEWNQPFLIFYFLMPENFRKKIFKLIFTCLMELVYDNELKIAMTTFYSEG